MGWGSGGELGTRTKTVGRTSYYPKGTTHLGSSRLSPTLWVGLIVQSHQSYSHMQRSRSHESL